MRAWVTGAANPRASLQVLGLIDHCWGHRAELTLADVLQRLDRMEATIRPTYARLRSVCALAVDQTGVYRFGRVFKAASFSNVKVRSLAVRSDGVLLGWDPLAA